jgi:hypothetical protein
MSDKSNDTTYIGVATSVSTLINRRQFYGDNYDFDEKSTTPELEPKHFFLPTNTFSGKDCTVEKDGNIIFKMSLGTEYYKCCVCNECVTDTASHCSNMHCTCTTCRENMEKYNYNTSCPICRDTDYRVSPWLINILKTAQSPCPNSDNGCKRLLFPIEKDEHSMECEFIGFDCPICDAKTDKMTLNNHLLTECEQKFSSHSIIDCVNDNVKSSNILIETEIGRTLLILKGEIECKIFCIDCMGNKELYTNLKIFNKKSLKSSIEVHMVVKIPIHRTKDLISKKIEYYKFPITDFKHISSISGDCFDVRKTEQKSTYTVDQTEINRIGNMNDENEQLNAVLNMSIHDH